MGHAGSFFQTPRAGIAESWKQSKERSQTTASYSKAEGGEKNMQFCHLYRSTSLRTPSARAEELRKQYRARVTELLKEDPNWTPIERRRPLKVEPNAGAKHY
eukprot:6182791-Pyramimonas_sp.AAC.1